MLGNSATSKLDNGGGNTYNITSILVYMIDKELDNKNCDVNFLWLSRPRAA